MMIKYQDKEIDLPNGSSGKDLAEKLNQRDPNQSLALLLNGQVKDLATPLNESDEVNLLGFDDEKGKEVFWHSSAHVLAQAILRLWPDAQPTIGPPIESGFYYDFANLQISEDDFPKIEKEVLKIIKENHKPERKEFEGKKQALAAFKANPYKCELIESFEENQTFSGYQQGEFFDLCRGPHLPSLGKIKAFKVLKTSGAYWRGDSKNEMLTRIYGISFPDKKQLKDYLTFLEEAKKRDHRLLGAKLDLFSFKEQAPGSPFLHPNGIFIWNTLLDFWRTLHESYDYVEIKTPQIMNQDLWKQSGHWDHYKENMYHFEIEDRAYAIKPMNCPGCMLYYKSQSHSYREFPLKIGELGHVYRHEASGSLNGLFRVRSFHQDDAHIFMKEEQIKDSILEVLEITKKIYDTFGLNYHFELSTRPEKSKTIGTDEQWRIATDGLKDALDEWGEEYNINEGDGAFYGPKIDLHIKDSLGRTWQCGTIQLDMSLPERFDLTYMDHDGNEKRPVMIHRALYGSVERFFGILVEHFAGKFPLWVSPRQVTIMTVADRHIEYASTVVEALKSHNIRCQLDCSSESISKKVRTAQLLQTNYMLTIGDKEVENKTVALRTRDNVVHGELQLEDFLQKIVKEIQTRSLASPFSKN